MANELGGECARLMKWQQRALLAAAAALSLACAQKAVALTTGEGTIVGVILGHFSWLAILAALVPSFVTVWLSFHFSSQSIGVGAGLVYLLLALGFLFVPFVLFDDPAHPQIPAIAFALCWPAILVIPHM